MRLKKTPPDVYNRDLERVLRVGKAGKGLLVDIFVFVPLVSLFKKCIVVRIDNNGFAVASGSRLDSPLTVEGFPLASRKNSSLCTGSRAEYGKQRPA